MIQIAEIFKAIPRALLIVGVVAAGLMALFVAWWIAVIMILGFSLYVAVLRILARNPAQASGGGPAIIEGEYRVEGEGRIERHDSTP